MSETTTATPEERIAKSLERIAKAQERQATNTAEMLALLKELTFRGDTLPGRSARYLRVCMPGD